MNALGLNDLLQDPFLLRSTTLHVRPTRPTLSLALQLPTIGPTITMATFVPSPSLPSCLVILFLADGGGVKIIVACDVMEPNTPRLKEKNISMHLDNLFLD
jgi:hypothetical protein